MPVTSLKKGYKLILMLLRLNVCNSVILPLHTQFIIPLNMDKNKNKKTGLWNMLCLGTQCF